MNTIIHQICNEFYSNVCVFFENNDRKDLLTAEQVFISHINGTVRQLLELHLNMLEDGLYNDKAGRKAERINVVRRNDERTVLSKFGEINYRRTYYKDERNNCYRYLVDEIAGIEKYQRVSTGVGLDLAKAARDNSYAKSSSQITGGKISRQTVMHKV